MEAALNRDFVSIEDYLAGEQASGIRHEYVGGAVYAMAGASKEHNALIGNIYASLRSSLRGTSCRAFFLDLKVRLTFQEQEVFYYPDLMVGCDPRDTHGLYLCYPKILIEITSESTERLDRQEKRSAYQTIGTLQEYLIISQDRVEVTLFRRRNNWRPELFDQSHASVPLESIGPNLPVSVIYEGVH